MTGKGGLRSVGNAQKQQQLFGFSKGRTQGGPGHRATCWGEMGSLSTVVVRLCPGERGKESLGAQVAHTPGMNAHIG